MSGSSPESGASAYWWKLGFAALIAGQSMVFGLAVNLDPPEGSARFWLHTLLAVSSVAVFVLVGLPLVREAWLEALRGRIVVEQLFLLGIAGAFGASVHASLTGFGTVYYEVVAVLLAIYSIGRIVGQNRRRSALQSAGQLRREFDRCARLSCCGREEDTPVAAIRAGDRVRIRAGGGVPVDGRVLEGEAFVRETPLTGEPFPVVKRPGDRVFAGGHVLDQALVVEAERDGESRRLDGLLAAVEDCRRVPSGMQREADRMVAWFLPLVVVVSLLTFVGWTWSSGWVTGMFHSLAVLVVACPCALGLATPVGIWNALGALAARGFVVNSGEWIERLARVDTVVFDKTGTLSEERLKAVDFVVADGVDAAALRRGLAAMQFQLDHPVALAFRHWAGEGGLSELDGAPRVIPATGVAARVRGLGLLEAGNERLLEEEDAPAAEVLRGKLHGGAQGRECWVRLDGRPVGLVLLHETLRESSERAMEALRSAGLEVRVMTGDRPEHAARLGLVEVEAGMTPEEKAARVRELQAEGRRILFVGDGINDAAAMSEAEASLALASGASLAREAAHAQLFGFDLDGLAPALRMSRRVVRGIRVNLAWSVGYNIVGISLAAAGLIHPVWAAVLMLLSSLSVTWRALRAAEGIHEEFAGAGVEVELPDSSGEHRTYRSYESPAATAQPGFTAALLLAAAVAVCGPLLAYLSGLGPGAGAALGLVFAMGAWVLFLYRDAWQRAAFGGPFTFMLGLGTLGMLLGWWADAGFAAVVRDGACMCGCAGSNLGLGLLGGLNWMNGGMLLFSLPAFWLGGEAARGSQRAVARFALCLALMLLGMNLGAWSLSRISITEGTPHFFFSFGAMWAGMALAMLLLRAPGGRNPEAT